MKILFLACFAVISLGFARGESPDSTVSQLLRNVRAKLPKGWTASYHKEYAWLQISRDEPVLWASAVSNGPGGEEPKRKSFDFAFCIVAAVQPAEYQRLSIENANIQKEATALYKALLGRQVSRKFDDFLPSTEEDMAAVARYEELKKSLHRLPDFYFDDISLQWAYNSPDNPTMSVIDRHIRDECGRVQKRVMRLLSKY